MSGVYLHDIPLTDALSRFDAALQEAGLDGLLGVEEIPLGEAALGRVLAEAVWAKLSSPHYHASAMDGFAVRAEETAEATTAAPVMPGEPSRFIWLCSTTSSERVDGTSAPSAAR